MLIINSNGSKWYGDLPDPVDMLIERLEKYPLDPRRADFVHQCLQYKTEYDDNGNTRYVDSDRPIYPEAPTALRFHGNFFELSAVFSIDTDEPDVIERLTSAIRANQQTEAYQQARKACGL